MIGMAEKLHLHALLENLYWNTEKVKLDLQAADAKASKCMHDIREIQSALKELQDADKPTQKKKSKGVDYTEE